MTGQEHYEEAERILSRLNDGSAVAAAQVKNPDPRVVGAVVDAMVKMAQVHATLALAQATLVVMEREDWARS